MLTSRAQKQNTLFIHHWKVNQLIISLKNILQLLLKIYLFSLVFSVFEAEKVKAFSQIFPYCNYFLINKNSYIENTMHCYKDQTSKCYSQKTHTYTQCIYLQIYISSNHLFFYLQQWFHIFICFTWRLVVQLFERDSRNCN